MKKLQLLFLSFCLSITFIKAQTTCATAISLNSYTGAVLTQTDQTAWYYFSAASNDMILDVVRTNTSIVNVDSVLVYQGGCASPTLIVSTARQGNLADSVIQIESRLQNLSIGNSYYFKVILKASNSANYKIYLADASASSCNLMTNGDFENLGLTPCPTYYYGCSLGAGLIPSWTTGGYSAVEIMSPCDPSYTMAATAIGAPHSGNVMANIATGVISGPLAVAPWINDTHNYIKSLFTPLTFGKKYYVQMFYRKHGQWDYYVSDGLGMLLTNGPPTINTNTLCQMHNVPVYTPQIQNPANNIMTNYNWLPMSGVITASGGESCITIGNFKPGSQTNIQTYNLNGMATAASYLVDDVSITPMDIANTSYSVCQGMNLTLTPPACTPPYCTSTYTWLPATGLNNYNILNPVTSATANTTYTLTQVITNQLGTTITNTALVTVNVSSPPFTFTPTVSSQVFCQNTASNVTLTANYSSSPGTNFLWTPGAYTSVTQTVAPTVNTTYSLTLTNGTCAVTKTVSVVLSNACCTSTAPVYPSTTFPMLAGTNNLYGPYVFNADVTVPAGAIVTFSGVAIFAPNVKIIVSPGAIFTVSEAHLYACNTMWQGIVVNDGGQVRATKHSLIEDAVTAIDVTAHATSTITLPNLIVDVDNTVFNKNHIGINIDGYQRSSTAYPFKIHSSVFTSRNFTYTSSSWPMPFITTGDLRAAVNATTGLLAPYTMQGASIANLLSPYSAQSALTGIKINNCGLSSGNYIGVEIGSVTASTLFNVFDALMYGIDGYSSNINSINNVFQNAQRIYFCPRCYYDGGTGIRDYAGANLNTRLNLSVPTSTIGNMFWDCYTGVDMGSVFKLDCNYATFRSTQTNTNTAYTPGNTGISAATNRFEYAINNCNFNNINTAINIPISSGTYTYAGNTNTGVYAGNLTIQNNYFGAQVNNSTAITNQYMNYAVNLTAPNTATWQNVAGIGLSITTNTVNRSFRGIYVNGFIYPSFINTNTVSLVNDNVFSTVQNGIRVVNSTGVAVTTNSLNAVNTTNTLVALIYSGSNSGHNVLCNNTYTAYTGFQFDGAHAGTNVWKGNKMQVLANGFYLTNSGAIGTQGAVSNPIDNQWNGTWTGNFHTNVDGTSNGSNSKFYTKAGGVYQPTLNAGGALLNYNTAGYVTTTTGTYVCSGGGGGGGRFAFSGHTKSEVMPANSSSSGNRLAPTLTNAQYISLTANYRYLMLHDSIRNSDTSNINFCNSLAGSSIDKFMQTENSFYTGDSQTAQSISSAVTATNDVEANYKQYYTLYYSYAGDSFNATDSVELYNFAQKCPGIDGACVYQARALYNSIYNNAFNFTDGCKTEYNARKLNPDYTLSQNKWSVELYPNPANKFISIVSNKVNETLQVVIKDINGRVLASHTLITQDFIANLDLNLINGVYLVTVKNSNNESTTKKMVIAN